MTEFSYPWSCTVSGDGGANSYSLDIVEDTNKLLANLDPDESGVVYYDASPLAGKLEPTNPAGATVRIASGVGVVEGWIYTNDANVDFDINAAPGNANAVDIIALRRSLAGQTVRLVRLNGAASSTAVLTQTAATWEVALAEVTLDGAGNFSSLADVRKFAISPLNVLKARHERQGGSATVWATVGTTNYVSERTRTYSGSNRMTILSGNSSVTLILVLSGASAFSDLGQVIVSLKDPTVHVTQPIIVGGQFGGGTINLYAQTADGANVGANTDVDVDWFAIGPIA